jgi:hypothetical protein
MSQTAVAGGQAPGHASGSHPASCKHPPRRARGIERAGEADEGRQVDDGLDDLGRSNADVERNGDVVLELRLGAAHGCERGDGRELTRPVVEAGARIDVAVTELNDVASEIGSHVADPLDDTLALFACELPQPLPTSIVTIVTHWPPSSSDRGPSIARVGQQEDAIAESVQEAEELLQIEEADAWFEYLDSIRVLSGREERYGEVEPWAWARLSVRLRAIRARRAKLKPAAA